MDKMIIRQTLLSLEARALKSAREKYFDYVMEARLDRSEPIENDEKAQAETASDLSEALDDNVRDHVRKIESLQRIDFGPKSAVQEGALVKIWGRHFVVAVSTTKFSCVGKDLMGISTMSPIFESIEGLKAGDCAEFMGKKFVIEEVS